MWKTALNWGITEYWDGIMLKLFDTMNGLRFVDLMDVYSETNRLNAEDQYEYLDINEAFIRVEKDFYSYLSQVFFTTPGAIYAVWEERGRYICALRLEPFKDGYLLEGLETAPEYRKMGYASNLIRQVLNEMECPVYSHVHKKNKASMLTHKACGFSEYLDYAVYIDGSVNRNSLTLRWVKVNN